MMLSYVQPSLIYCLRAAPRLSIIMIILNCERCKTALAESKNKNGVENLCKFPLFKQTRILTSGEKKQNMDVDNKSEVQGFEVIQINI